jgi:hypothetical protein
MLSVLATGPKVHGFKSGDGFLRVIKIRSIPSLGREVKPYATSLEFTACKKSLTGINKNTSQDQIYHFLHPFLLLTTR